MEEPFAQSPALPYKVCRDGNQLYGDKHNSINSTRKVFGVRDKSAHRLGYMQLSRQGQLGSSSNEVIYSKPQVLSAPPSEAEHSKLCISAKANARQKSPEQLWLELFSDPSEWWDHRFGKTNARYPDFKHKNKQEALWVDNGSTPFWVKEKLSLMAPGTIDRNGLSWTAAIIRYVKEGSHFKALEVFNNMRRNGVNPDKFAFVSIFKACTRLRNLEEGRCIHRWMIENGCELDAILGSCLVDMYAKCGSISEACRVFENVVTRDVVLWNAMIVGHVKCCQGRQALELFHQMQEEQVEPDNVTFVGVLNACASIAALEEGKLAHAAVVQRGFESDAYVANCLVDMYAKCGSLEDASRVFDNMPRKDVVSWNAMIMAYAKCAQGENALEIFRLMQKEKMDPNRVTFMAVLKACSSIAALEVGKLVHLQIIQRKLDSDIVMKNCLIDMYVKCGSIESACEIFNNMPLRDVVSWNTLIVGFVKCGHGEKALEVFERMRQEKVKLNAVTFVGVLNACTSIGALERGKLVHSHIIECGLDSDGFVGNNLIDMYAKCGNMEEAWKVFVNMPECNVVGWSSLIGGYVGCGMAEKALQLFQQMQQQKVKPNGVTFLAVLNACACLAALDEGRFIHAETIKHGMESDSYVQNCLIDMYAKCGSMEDACQVFNSMPSRDVVSWNDMVFGYVNSREGEKAIELFRQMQQEEVDPDCVTVVGALNACGSIAALEDGKLVHSYVVVHGLQSNAFVVNCLIDMYAKCGSINDAFNIFQNMPTRDVVSWSAMILGYVKCGEAQKALALFRQMQQEQVEPNSVTFIGTLKACSSISALEEARLVHAQIIHRGLQIDVHVANCLLDMYSTCGSIEDSWRVFNELPAQDLVSWNAMIMGYSKCGQERKAVDLFLQMQKEGMAPNNLTFIGALSACAKIDALEDGKLLHGGVIQCGMESDIIVANSLIDMYAKSGSIESAFRVFNTMHARDVVSWSTMIAGLAKCGHMEMVLELYGQMQQEEVEPNCVTFVGMLKACTNLLALEEGKLVHAQIVRMGLETDTFVGNCLVDMYAKCGSIEDSHRVFSSMPIRDVVLWNTMIMGYIKCGKEEHALDLFKQMQEQGMEPNAITYAEVVNACASIAALDEGKSIHAQLLRKGLEADPFVSNSLVNMYACCVNIEAASRVFHNMSERDVVSWNTMIMGHVKCENGEKALELFWHMQQNLVEPNSVTFVAALNACASVAALNEGKLIHAKAIRSGLEADSFVGNCLVDMYAKCGRIEDACRVFNNMAARDTVSWNTMLVSYGMHGLGRKSFKLFDLMSQEGAEPENCTFVSLLSAFSHVGLVDEGIYCFESMGPIHAIQPTVEHYSCMVDILGRSGELDEAENLIKTMHFESNLSVWMSLLGACRIHGNLQMGERAAKAVFKLDPGNSSGYVLLSHIYAENGCWDSSLRIQHMRKDRYVHKKPGCTWIEVNNQVHRFVADDKEHPQIEDIWAELNQLYVQMKKAGYVPNGQFMSHDVNEEPRGMSLYRHSERLAIAFGLIRTPLGSPIQIMKNLRVCEDCHTATKLISKIVGRSIIVRDSSRFHHFDNGVCSCNDYW